MRIPGAILVTLLVASSASLVWAGGREQSLSDDDRQAIESVLKARVIELVESHEEGRAPARRGTFSTDFKAVGPDTVQVTFHEDKAGREVLTTVRKTLTLTRDASGEWAISDELEEDRYEGFHRGVLGDEKFYRFEEFSFEREGLRVHARRGVMFEDLRAGAVERISLAAEDLSYDYAPPTHAGFEQTHFLVEKREARKLHFTPETVDIYCAPQDCREILDSAFSGLSETDEEGTSRELRDAYDDWLDDERDALEDDPFHGFAPLYEEDRRRWTVFVHRRGRSDDALIVDFDNYEPREVRVWLVDYRRPPLYSYHCAETRSSGLSPHALERRDDRTGRDYDIVGLQGTVSLALEDPEAMTADLTYRIRAKQRLEHLDFAINRFRPIASVRELTDPHLIVNSIQLADGQELTWVRTGARQGRLILPEPLDPKHHITLRIRFENRDCIFNLNDSYKGLARLGWMPFVGWGDMIHYFDITVRAPADCKTLGIGALIDERVEGDVRITHWRSQSPVVFPTVIFGKYVEAEPSGVARKLDGTVIPVTMHVDKIGMMDWNIRLKQLEPLANQAVASINFYTQLYQVDYPYGKMDLVNDPLGALYGQSPSSIIYLGSAAFRGSGFLVHAIDGGNTGSVISNFSKNLVPHEVAHQWWGSLITNANMRNYWFIESLAEYSSALFVEAAYGREAYDERVEYWKKQILENTPTSSVQDSSHLWSDGGYIAAVYNKGPYAFHMLREMFGDVRLKRFLRNLAQELAGREIVTRDIQRVAEKSYGRSMDWFFDQWIRGIGIPEYCFDYDTRETEDGQYLIEGTVLQRVVAGKRRDVLDGVFYASVVPLTIVCEDGREYVHRIVVDSAETRIAIKVPSEPRDVTLNDHNEALAHQVRLGSGF